MAGVTWEAAKRDRLICSKKIRISRLLRILLTMESALQTITRYFYPGVRRSFSIK